MYILGLAAILPFNICWLNKGSAGNEKSIALNDLEENVKLSILSDIERDQRTLQLKETMEKNFQKLEADRADFESKHKHDHIMFDRYVKK